MARYLRIALGAVFTIALALAPWVLLTAPGSTGPAALPALWQYWTGKHRTLVLEFDRPTDVAIGDVIFIAEGAPGHPTGLRRVGEIQELLADGHRLDTRRAEVVEASAFIYPAAPDLGAQPALIYETKPDTFVWVVDALLTPERKKLLMSELQQAIDTHRAEIVAAFRPVIEHSLRDLLGVLEQDLPPAIERHQPQFAALRDRYRREILNKDFLPLVKSDVLPIVRQRAEPVLREVGQELWQQVSLWRFGWRFAYDLSPLPEKNLMDREWNRFVEQDALPVLERHSDQFVNVIKDILRDVSRDERLQEAARNSLNMIASDPDSRSVLRELFEEVVVRNRHFREALERELSAPETRQAIEVAARRLEPAIRRAGDMIVGTQSTGITPEFARVLRTEILDKDERWFLLEPGSGAAPSAAGRPLRAQVRYASH
ncbi:MAG TPA: hypothetical protein VHV55_16735 [Pirellulales bacterium]|jgi:hypothetical protein|nr:hypothetical protein [Pirellulales bacterium]